MLEQRLPVPAQEPLRSRQHTVQAPTYLVPSMHRPPFDPRMEAGLQVRPLVVGYTWALCRAIASCAELLGVLRLLDQAASTLFQIHDAVDQPCAVTEAANEELRSCRRALLAAVSAAAVAPGAEQRQLLRYHLYSSSAFHDLSEMLLTGERAAAAAGAAVVCLPATQLQHTAGGGAQVRFLP